MGMVMMMVGGMEALQEVDRSSINFDLDILLGWNRC